MLEAMQVAVSLIILLLSAGNSDQEIVVDLCENNGAACTTPLSVTSLKGEEVVVTACENHTVNVTLVALPGANSRTHSGKVTDPLRLNDRDIDHVIYYSDNVTKTQGMTRTFISVMYSFCGKRIVARELFLGGFFSSISIWYEERGL